MKESRALECKETVTNSFLKTVSAYANYGRGQIVFGIDDEGKTSGISDKWLRTSSITAGIPVAAPSHDEDARMMHPEGRRKRWRRGMQAA